MSRDPKLGDMEVVRQEDGTFAVLRLVAVFESSQDAHQFALSTRWVPAAHRDPPPPKATLPPHKPPAAPPRPRPPLVSRVSSSPLRIAYDKFVGNLPHLFEQLERIRAKDVQSLYAVHYTNANLMLRQAARDGHGDYVKIPQDRGSGFQKVLVPVGSAAGAAETAKTEMIEAERLEAVLRVLREEARKSPDNTVQLATAAISARSHVPLGMIPILMLELMEEKRIMMARPQHGTSAPIYQVLETEPA